MSVRNERTEVTGVTRVIKLINFVFHHVAPSLSRSLNLLFLSLSLYESNKMSEDHFNPELIFIAQILR